MMTDVVPLERVQQAFETHTFAVHDRQSAISFLRSKELSKAHTSRYLAWMILLNGIPEDPNLWPLTFYHIIHSYRTKLDYYLSDPSKKVFNILKCLDDKSTDAIRSDVNRALKWFKRFAETIGIDDNLLADPEIETRIVRMICIMIREAPQFHYLQGYDRFAFVSFSLSLYFSIKLGLGLIEAEAFSVSLYRRLISLSDVATFLKNQSYISQYFSDIDGYLLNWNRKKMLTLLKAPLTSVDFASNWVGVLFSDIHTPPSCLLIWDHILLHQNDFKRYFNALVSAHLNQIEDMDDPYEQLTAIQNFGEWNVEDLIDEAESQMRDPIIQRTSLTGFTGFWL